MIQRLDPAGCCEGQEETSCDYCDGGAAPAVFQVIVSGFASVSCANCTNLNATWNLSRITDGQQLCTCVADEPATACRWKAITANPSLCAGSGCSDFIQLSLGQDTMSGDYYLEVHISVTDTCGAFIGLHRFYKSLGASQPDCTSIDETLTSCGFKTFSVGGATCTDYLTAKCSDASVTVRVVAV